MIKKIKVGSDFSGVGAFDYAIKRVSKKNNFKLETVFACDWDKYARITYAHNHGTPKYYPKDVYEREIPTDSLDIYMTSPPCQAFSIAGNRKGKGDERGILFFNSHEFIKKNKPRFFIFENVKGLLSDNAGKTFNEWVNMLAGKSINGLPVLFPYENSVPYHLYWKVLNSKKYGIPQNRERVFLVGIRDNEDNVFQFPKEEYLNKKIKDVLENEVDEKYFLSEKLVNQLLDTQCNQGVILKQNSVADELQKIKIGDYRTDEGFRWRLDNTSPAIMAMTRDTWSEKFSGGNPPIIEKYQVLRRLTPRECFRLQDFPEKFDFSVVSDSQAYKQAGNSITVRVLERILEKLKL
jgi:DNA (cytosine-5)-methyltransferase 1